MTMSPVKSISRFRDNSHVHQGQHPTLQPPYTEPSPAAAQRYSIQATHRTYSLLHVVSRERRSERDSVLAVFLRGSQGRRFFLPTPRPARTTPYSSSWRVAYHLATSCVFFQRLRKRLAGLCVLSVNLRKPLTPLREKYRKAGRNRHCSRENLGTVLSSIASLSARPFVI